MLGKKGFQHKKNHWNWKGGKVKSKCEQCGKTIESNRSRVSRFCSRECYLENPTSYWKGKKIPQEAREKMRKAKLGKPSPKKGMKFPQFSGKNHPNWKGGRYQELRGYIVVKAPYHPHCGKNGGVYEHRLVMEKHLKRFLEPNEIVHHKNKIKNDNRVENLMLFNNSSEHIKHHKK